MSLIDDLNTINTIKANIKTAIENKGQTVTNFGSYPEAINNISGSGPIKLFNTVEEMQNDENPIEGDLAVVYAERLTNATVDSEFKTAKFQKTVILPEAMTDYVDLMYRAVDNSVMFDCWGSLDRTSFSMTCYTENGSIEITYTSSDGITYTRTDILDEIIDFGTEIYYPYAEMWNDAIGYFIQAGGKCFDGLFEYLPYSDTTKIKPVMINDLIFDGLNVTWNGEYSGKVFEKSAFASITDKIMSDTGCTWTKPICVCIKNGKWNIFIPQDEYISATQMYMNCLTCINNNGVLTPVGIGSNQAHSTLGSPITNPPRRFEVDLDSQTYIDMGVTPVIEYQGSTYYYSYVDFIPDSIVYTVNPSTEYFAKSAYPVVYLDTNSHFSEEASYGVNYIYLKYITATTQLTLNNVNQLLPGVIGYGKNGIIVGDDSVYDNIPSNKYTDRVLQYEEIITPNAASGDAEQIYPDTTLLMSYDNNNMSNMVVFTDIKEVLLQNYIQACKDYTGTDYTFSQCSATDTHINFMYREQAAGSITVAICRYNYKLKQFDGYKIQTINTGLTTTMSTNTTITVEEFNKIFLFYYSNTKSICVYLDFTNMTAGESYSIAERNTAFGEASAIIGNYLWVINGNSAVHPSIDRIDLTTNLGTGHISTNLGATCGNNNSIMQIKRGDYEYIIFTGRSSNTNGRGIHRIKISSDGLTFIEWTKQTTVYTTQGIMYWDDSHGNTIALCGGLRDAVDSMPYDGFIVDANANITTIPKNTYNFGSGISNLPSNIRTGIFRFKDGEKYYDVSKNSPNTVITMDLTNKKLSSGNHYVSGNPYIISNTFVYNISQIKTAKSGKTFAEYVCVSGDDITLNYIYLGLGIIYGLTNTDTNKPYSFSTKNRLINVTDRAYIDMYGQTGD